ncbi:MAG: peptidoglycan DD-metalloendopeptidase family protein [Epsilonproteobacteria bacterium]|nr:hypothetical protein [Campylobacterota bacterium]NPA56165.1 peptidoglycan DD-metalloendopeptidase family protein [Campylobacterota bacterium]
MKNKFIVTITDIHGSRQYTLNLIVKRLLWWLVALVALTIAGTYSLNLYLNERLQEMERQKNQLIREQIRLKKENSAILLEKRRLEALNFSLLARQQELIQENSMLQDSIREQREALNSLNGQLKEVEKILGIEDEIDEANISSSSSLANLLQNRIEQIKEKGHENLREVRKLTKRERKLLERSVPTGRPLKYRRVSAPFGYRLHPIYQKKMFHFGIDLVAPIGTPIYAPADGVVFFRGVKSGYGKFLLLNHPFGFSTAYGHLSRIVVRQGEFVQKGELIAYVGNTGRTTGPHLHYEVRYLSYWLDPSKFINWRRDTFSNFERIGRVDWQGLLKLLRKRYYLSQKVGKR